MAIPARIARQHKSRAPPRTLARFLLLLVLLLLLVVVVVVVVAMVISILSFSSSSSSSSYDRYKEYCKHDNHRYVYWGERIDCPGKHCDSCAGLGHQESSLRCALEEALFLRRVFVMPSRMCINPIHNKKGILRRRSNNGSSEDRWEANFCAMDSLYDIDLISRTVPVILDNSKAWYQILLKSTRLGKRGIAHVQGISRAELKEKCMYSDVLLINRTASPLAWFTECKDRANRSSVMLPYSFLPRMASRRLRDAAEKIEALLRDYDAVHVRRGDKMATRKDEFGVVRTLHPHLDRDTRPESIQRRIAKWIAPGRTIFIASNERTPGFFSPLSARYRLAYSSNFSEILDPVIENNYQLFIVERLVMSGAKTFVKTFREDENDLYLTDDPKKNNKNWQIPVYTADGEGT
ncbi:uncharacterized protein LOC109723878 isoform X3 [Ananas comosus]|uniref:Uncharacterized protein LOC109723878 isoform X3 n=1 Tax=Ananas comosus TaxID=4615 RepID=A0A6P5GH34_ANACO|nr:uncharacterized protein LOC109723878 isoform X3 [Ananas comosus]